MIIITKVSLIRFFWILYSEDLVYLLLNQFQYRSYINKGTGTQFSTPNHSSPGKESRWIDSALQFICQIFRLQNWLDWGILQRLKDVAHVHTDYDWDK